MDLEEFNYFKHWHLFLKDQLVISLPSKLQLEFITFLHERDFKWESGTKLLDENGKQNLSLSSGECVRKKVNTGLTRSSVKWYIENGKKAIVFKGF